MNKYQIKEIKEIYNHASSKAVEDVCNFAKEAGYAPLYVRQRTEDTGIITLVRNQWGFFWDWFKALSSMKKNSILLLQNPFKRKHLGRFTLLKVFKKLKKLTIISVIHDVEELRLAYYRDFSSKEFKFMESNSDYFIVHNHIMKDYFLERGFKEESLVELGIFDYGFGGKVSSDKPEDERADVVIAGNLAKDKCPYVYKLFNLTNKVSFNLYGPSYETDKTADYINYCGSFPADEVPKIINGKYGLIWDGEDIHKCAGDTGNYLRYNNPHKTSLYIISKTPIIIWEEAALAGFVKENNIGITIRNLEDIKAKISIVSDEEYSIMKNNINEMAGKLQSGYHLRTALAECEKRING